MISKEICISELKRIYNKYGKVTYKLLKEYGNVSGDSIKRTFGSMENALKEAGLPIKQGQRKMVSKEEITEEIFRLVNEYGYISKPLMEKHSSYSPKIVQRIFGSFANMYNELNLERCRNGIIPTDEELIEEAKRLYETYGYFSQNIIIKYGKYSTTCYGDRARKNGWDGLKYYREQIGCPEPELGWTESPDAKYEIDKFTKYLNEEPIKEKTFDWLINEKTGLKLRIDAYYKNHNIAIEYNGPQHYKVDGLYTKDEEQLKYRQNLDYLKYELIKAHGIKLVIIHYMDKVDENYIKTVLK